MNIKINNNVWQKILMYVPALKLLKIREVSKELNDQVETVIKNYDIWKMICSDDKIAPWVHKIVELIGAYQLIPSIEEIEADMWKKIFYSFKKWRFCVNYNYEIGEFLIIESSDERIVSCDVYGHHLAIGTSLGKVNIFHITSDELELISDFRHYPIAIKDLEFWHTGDSLLLVIIHDNNNAIFWNVDKNDQFFLSDSTNSKFSMVRRGTRHQIILNDSNKFQRSKTEGDKTLSRVFRINVLDEENNSLSVEDFCDANNQITILALSGDKIIIETFPGNSKQEFYLKKKLDTSQVIKYIPITNLVFVIDDTILYTSTINDSNQWETKEHILTESFKKKISSIVMHSNVIFFGTKNGKIYIFSTLSIQQLQKCQLCYLPYKKLNIDSNPIIKLNITEINDKILIVAVTATKIFTIDWHN
ncbi:uncharacterized protein LOC130674343 [Microplitis mediator]|uniref:uncharacterized protein LOC130674343 n=1 Tax=Microplitis mediator TaxID=375433 RepID=UPI0025575071|nr:uncharacterized protein LOC130674343 [Microplitis mediator]